MSSSSTALLITSLVVSSSILWLLLILLVSNTLIELHEALFNLVLILVDYILASNGNPRSPDSLHYIDPSGRLNSY